MTANRTVPVLIGTALEAEQVARTAAIDPAVEVLYAPELLPPARFAGDHDGPPRDLSGADLDRWRSLRAGAEVSFDFDWLDPAGMAANCQRVTVVGLGHIGRRTCEVFSALGARVTGVGRPGRSWSTSPGAR